MSHGLALTRRTRIICNWPAVSERLAQEADRATDKADTLANSRTRRNVRESLSPDLVNEVETLVSNISSCSQEAD